MNIRNMDIGGIIAALDFEALRHESQASVIAEEELRRGHISLAKRFREAIAILRTIDPAAR